MFNEIISYIIKPELLVGVSTFVLGYLSHVRSSNERRAKSKANLYKLELDNLNNKQSSIQEYMENAIDKLTSERMDLYGRIDKLEDKIDRLEEEAYHWQVKYLEVVRDCPDASVEL